MAYYALRLQAGIPYTHNVAGKLILLDSTGDADGVDIATIRNGTPQATMPMRKAAFRVVETYDGVMLTAAVTTTVGIFLSFEDVQLGVADGAAVKVPEGVNITNVAPIPVEFAGTVAPVLGVVTVSNTNANAIPVQQRPGAVFEVRPVKAGAVVNSPPVAITDVAGLLLPASAARRGARIRNVGPNTIAIGAVGVVFDDAAVLINPGETWNEDEAPGAAWYAICQDGESARINIQEIN